MLIIVIIIIIIIVIIIIIIVIITAHFEIHGAFHDSRVFPQVTADAAQVKARGRPTSSATAGGRTSRRGSPGVPRIRRKMGEKPYWLVVWNMFSIHWEKSSQLTFVFSLRGWIHQRRIRSLDGFIWLLDDFDQVISWIFYKDVKATNFPPRRPGGGWFHRMRGPQGKGPRDNPVENQPFLMWPKQCHLHHPPVITISIGAMFTVPRHGWFMTLFQPHQMMFGTSWYFYVFFMGFSKDQREFTGSILLIVWHLYFRHHILNMSLWFQSCSQHLGAAACRNPFCRWWIQVADSGLEPIASRSLSSTLSGWNLDREDWWLISG